MEEEFSKPQQFSMRKYLEFLGALFLSLLILALGGFFLVTYYIDQTLTEPSSVLGESVENENAEIREEIPPIIINSAPEQNTVPETESEAQIEITNGVTFSKYYLFDNRNSSQIEGTGPANSRMELRIANSVEETVSGPGGFFSFEIGDPQIQFAEASLIAFDEQDNPIESYNFIIILRYYLNRAYFLFNDRKEVFSIKLDKDYRLSERMQVVKSFECTAEFLSNHNESDNNRPGTIVLNDENDLVPVAFYISNNINASQIESCTQDFMQHAGSLTFHTNLLP